MGLETYQRKRDFAKTPEPKGVVGPAGGGRYLVQKHAATRLHYDFRLELDGVLLSWAVPRGPSLDPRDRHLAVHVEDHPLEYGDFEGTIPAGEYGGGTVLLWDRGTWEPEGDPRAGLEKGELKFTLHGDKLRGSWVLVKMKARSYEEGKDEWLLIKHRDEHSVDGDGQDVLGRQPQSVASGRTLEQVAADRGTSVWHGDRPADAQSDVRPAEEFRLDPATLPGARKVGRPPGFVAPQLTQLVETPPTGGDWLHEIKLDGYRALARLEDGAVRMYSRNQKDWTDRYASVAEDLARLPVASAVLDGEVVVQLPEGRTDFQALQTDMGAGRTDRLLYYVFDVSYLDGYDLTAVPLQERKALLRRLIARAPQGARLRFTDHIQGEGAAVLRQACSFGLEGVVSKKAGAPYRPGQRGTDWRKAKCLLRQEFVVGGFTDAAGSRVGFGALLVGVHEDAGLHYVGRVGTGFDDRLLRVLGERLRAMEVADPPFERALERAPKGSHWVRPELVAEVAFAEWTRDGEIRHPSFKGLRDDKEEESVVEERPQPSSGGGKQTPVEVRGVKMTHPERVFWPTPGITKRALVDYYESVGDRMLPYVLHRPVSMLRCPDGVAGVEPEDRGGPCFFHKHAGPDFPGPFERVEIRESEGLQTYLTITEPGSLVALAQMGVLEVHIWGARWPDIEHPDMMVFDLDPDPSVGWSGAVEGARLVRVMLSGLGLESFVKTTGGKGLHVVVPFRPTQDWDTVKRFAKAVADGIVTYAPDRFTSSMAKARRPDKTFVDYLRNGRSATSVAPYSTRAKPLATVSVPLRWDELGGLARPDSHTIKNLHRRLARLKSDPWEGYFELQESQALSDDTLRDVGLAL